MEILIISGLSGSGKSRAATYLEDVGYYTVDNLPAEMMLRFADFCAAAGGRYDKLAFVYDVRVGEPPENLTAAVSQLRVRGNRCRLLFLEADTPTIIRRYKETRRSHPLCADGCSIETAVSRERELLRLLHRQAPQHPAVHLRCVRRRTPRERPLLRLQKRSAAGGRPGAGCPLPAQPLLRPGAEVPQRAGRAGAGLCVSF